MLTNLEGKYIGPDKIKSAKKIERKTLLDSEVYEVELDNKTKVEYPVSLLEAITTKEKGDLASLRELVCKPVVGKILSILVDAEITIEDINFILQTKLVNSIQESVAKVYAQFWGKEKYKLTLRDIDERLKLKNK